VTEKLTESDLVIIGYEPGTAKTPAGLVVPENMMATPSGLVVQKRQRWLCRYCGAPHHIEKGCELHEAQCREQVRAQWTMSMLGGPAAMSMTAAQVDEYIRAVIIEYEKRKRTTWTEMGDSAY
jgi:hypothetical protein